MYKLKATWETVTAVGDKICVYQLCCPHSHCNIPFICPLLGLGSRMGMPLDFQKEALTIRIISYLQLRYFILKGLQSRICEQTEILTNKYKPRQK